MASELVDHILAGWIPVQIPQGLPPNLSAAVRALNGRVAELPGARRAAGAAHKDHRTEQEARAAHAKIVGNAVDNLRRAAAEVRTLLNESHEVAARMEQKSQQWLAERATPWATTQATRLADEWRSLSPAAASAAMLAAEQGEPSLEVLLALKLSGRQSVDRVLQRRADPLLATAAAEVARFAPCVERALQGCDIAAHTMAQFADSPEALKNMGRVSAVEVLNVAFNVGNATAPPPPTLPAATATGQLDRLRELSAAAYASAEKRNPWSAPAAS